MAWLQTRNVFYSLLVISAAVLLFGSSFGIDITKGLVNTFVSWAVLIAAGQIYMIYALMKTYI